ncbi:MAG: GNAT family N-acetyltransferase [Chloroflexi bacterium]|nr:GNAT family N-acetyltransferase [Chloroflexota bacterium]MBI4504793.1 GNAT family N-acetyltransferase [Chloroflexota bacterium]
MSSGGCTVQGLAFTVQQEAFASLSADWEALATASSSGSIFTTWRWQQLWHAHLEGDYRLVSLVARDEVGRLVGIAPLAEREGTVVFGGGAEVSDYLDVIVGDDHRGAIVAALADALAAAGWLGCDLRSVPAESPLLEALPPALRARGYDVLVERDDVCPRVELPGDWERYLAQLSKKDRHELRRKMRRLDAAGQVRWYGIADAGDLPAALDDFLRLHRASRSEKAVFMDARRERFFRALADTFFGSQTMRLYFLELDGRRVAATICFDHRDETWLYNSGYDPRYGALSVGLVLKALCLQDAIARGKRCFDFLRGNERYKYDLGASDRLVMRLRARRT